MDTFLNSFFFFFLSHNKLIKQFDVYFLYLPYAHAYKSPQKLSNRFMSHYFIKELCYLL